MPKIPLPQTGEKEAFFNELLGFCEYWDTRLGELKELLKRALEVLGKN